MGKISKHLEKIVNLAMFGYALVHPNFRAQKMGSVDFELLCACLL